MKTLANPRDQQELLERLSGVRPDSPRGWGKMTATQMVCHLNDSFTTKLGGKPVRSRANLFTRTVVKWAALWAPVPWPHGFKTPPELDQQIGGTPPSDFEGDRARLISLMKQFGEEIGGKKIGGKEINAHPSARHPFFGAMTTREWLRWAYLHVDHHLRQFGC